jgi:hypothetical protein
MSLKLTLDTAELEDECFQSFLKEHKIVATVIEAVGPAGGNPSVEYEGRNADLVAMYSEFFDNGDDLDDEEGA